MTKLVFIILSVIGILILIVVLFIMYRVFTVRRAQRKYNQEKFERIEPLIDKFDTKEGVSKADVLPYAANNSTRAITYHLLDDNDKLYLFPIQYETIEKAAESHLTNWLEFPDELGCAPDEMTLLERVSIDFEKNNVYYYVFKFMVNEPHLAAKEGWILGIVGPYFEDSKPFDFPKATFSRFSSKFGEITPEAEAKWVHENIALTKGVIK